MQIRAAARTLNLHGREFLTPLIVPSFSSRAKPPTGVLHFLQKTLPAIGGPILVSAYDVAHQPPDTDSDILREMTGANLSFVLLDSGGYEVFWNKQAVEAGLMRAGSAPEWSTDRYEAVLEAWPSELPLLAVSWDERDTSIAHQVQAAGSLADRFPQHAVELLLKPPPDGFIVGDISNEFEGLSKFPVIGVTEKEIGASMAARLQFIAELRDALADRGLDKPIHVFGGLDPQMTPLYHAAGADIFDGLSWLRYAYQDSQGIYDKSFVAIHSPRAIEEDQIWGMRARNIRDLVNLQIKMTRFQANSDFGVFDAAREQLERAWNECWS